MRFCKNYANVINFWNSFFLFLFKIKIIELHVYD